jgi:hypothetical protein
MKLYIASGHRTGSMHITHSIGKIINHPVTSGIPAAITRTGADEHMIQPMAAQTLFLLDDMIFHNHARGSAGNALWLKKSGMPVLVTVRNIFDVMMSLKEKSDLGISIPGVPSPLKDWNTRSEDQKWRWLAYNTAPWELQFFAAWATCGLKNIRWCVYEKFFADEVGGMIKILEWLGQPINKRKIKKVLKEDKTNLNVGGSGRGVKNCPQFAKDIVFAQIDAWGEPFKMHMLRDLT